MRALSNFLCGAVTLAAFAVSGRAQSALPAAQAGVAYSFQVATNPASPSGSVYGATGLPTGIGINASTGLINGTPTTPGSYTPVISILYNGVTNNFDVTLAVAPAAGTPTITSAASASGTVGTPFTYTVTVDSETGATSLNVGTLPAGLSFTADSTTPITGTISGTPTAFGTFDVPLSANNTVGTGATVTLVLAIAPPGPVPAITSATSASGQPNVAFTSYQITAGNSPTSYSAVGLPLGLSLDSVTGLISGTPSVPGAYVVALSASNANGTGPTVDLTISIGDVSAITSAATLAATVGQAASLQLAATNSPVSFNASGLPAGLALDTASGLISGTPTASGVSMVTVSANNSIGTGPNSTLTITVAASTIVNSLPVFTTQPVSATVVAGNNAMFTVTASGSPTPTFLWQVSTNGGTSWTALTDGTGISGSATDSLAISSTTASVSGYEYECVATNTQGSVTSSAATLTVNTPPSITTQPATQSVNAGSGIVLAVGATGASGYQWNLNGHAINGATGSTLSINNVTSANAGAYTVSVTNSAGTVTSGSATLTVNAAVVSSAIATQPVAQSINTGGSVVFTVVTGGSTQLITSSLRPEVSGLTADLAATTYQWQFNGVNLANGGGITGSTGPQLMIQGATAANDGDYACVVTNGSTTVLSDAAGLQVQTTSTPGFVISISSRAFVGTGDNILIGGFYIVGSTSATVLVQAIGPALAAAPYSVAGTLQHPALTIHQNQNGKDVVLYSNAGWGSSSVLLAAAAAAYAEPVLKPGSNDSELLMTLPAGGYTAEVAGGDNGTGVALCGIYQLQ
jgi:hypothetical protein